MAEAEWDGGDVKEIWQNSERVGVRGRFSLSADGSQLRSHGPDLRAIGLLPEQWIAVFGDSLSCAAMARVADAEQTAECVMLERVSWMPVRVGLLGLSNVPALQAQNRIDALRSLVGRDELSLYLSRPPS